jgi:hypothetical protein
MKRGVLSDSVLINIRYHTSQCVWSFVIFFYPATGKSSGRIGDSSQFLLPLCCPQLHDTNIVGTSLYIFELYLVFFVDFGGPGDYSEILDSLQTWNTC